MADKKINQFVDRFNETQELAADHLGDLLEATDELRADLNKVAGVSSGQTITEATRALNEATQATQDATELSNQALDAAQAIVEEASVLIAQATQADSEPLDSSFFDQAETITTSPAIAVEQYNNVAGFYRLIRDFVTRAKPWTESIRYFTKPDEKYDLTLVSRRVYGRSDEYIAIMAAADMDSVENTLEPQTLILPTPSMLHSLKLKAGYRNTDEMRFS